MNRTVWGLSLVVAAGAAWFCLRSASAPTTPPPHRSDSAPALSSEVPNETIRTASSPAASNHPTPSQLITGESRQAADRIRALIATQLAEAMKQVGDASSVAESTKSSVVPGVAAATTMPAPLGSSNQVNEALGRYVQDRVTKDFFPMGASCYQELLATRPDARGNIVLDVTIVGDPSVGGVVDAVEVDPASTLTDEKLAVCMRESMFGMPFDAPPSGQEKVTFTFPIELSPAPAQNAAAASQKR